MTTRTSARPTARTIFLIVCLAPFLWYGIFLIRYNLRAPLVINVQADTCYLSPGGTYMYVDLDRSKEYVDIYIYKTSRGELVPIHLPEPYNSNKYVWLDDDTFFYSYQWGTGAGTEPDNAPKEGWIVKMSTRTATNVATLPSQHRQHILALAQETYEEEYKDRSSSPISLDGNYQMYYNATSIQDVGSGEELNRTPWFRPEMCRRGWKPDSSGYYFIDGDAHMFTNDPGPVRLLLTHPPVP